MSGYPLEKYIKIKKIGTFIYKVILYNVMVNLLLEVDDEIDKKILLVKYTYGFKNKSDAIRLMLRKVDIGRLDD